MLEILASPSDGAEPIPVAYLGKGEVLGELALLTGSPRSATVRSPEHAELFTLEKAVFLDLMETLPPFARNLCLVLAKRLEATTLKVPRASGKQLQGNLRFFDLATVIQTLIGSHQTGQPRGDPGGGKQKVAEIFFFKGNIARAQVQAAHAATTPSSSSSSRPLEGEFSFTGRNGRGGRGADRHHDARHLAAHGVGAPAGRAAPAQGAGRATPTRVFRQKAAQLQWEDADTVELAAAVWSRLKKGASINDLHRDIPRCSYAIYRTLVAMLDAGMIA